MSKSARLTGPHAILCAAAAILSLILPLAPAAAQPGAAPANAPQAIDPAGAACGFDLSGPVYAKWNDMLGLGGRLGCPTQKEGQTLTTPYGATGRMATFAGRDKLGAAILWHETGPHAGQTIAVYGCFYRLYIQYGGPGGWLGMPIADPVSNPDGQTQAYEGGTITNYRAEKACAAKRNSEAPRQVAAADAVAKTALDLFFDPARGDYFSTATVAGAEAAAAAQYQRIRTEAYVFTAAGPGLSPLKLYWNETRGDNATVATIEGEHQMQAAGYEFGGTQGWVYTDPQPGAKPLRLYWNEARGDFFLTGSPEDEADAAANGYVFVRIEGYAAPGP